jgi:hypothetical protein
VIIRENPYFRLGVPILLHSRRSVEHDLAIGPGVGVAEFLWFRDIFIDDGHPCSQKK